MYNLTGDEEAAIRDALIAWKASGIEEPRIPVYSDMDGDGVPDFFGLDAEGNVVLISGVSIEDSVSVSDGTGIEAEGVGPWVAQQLTSE